MSRLEEFQHNRSDFSPYLNNLKWCCNVNGKKSLSNAKKYSQLELTISSIFSKRTASSVKPVYSKQVMKYSVLAFLLAIIIVQIQGQEGKLDLNDAFLTDFSASFELPYKFLFVIDEKKVNVQKKDFSLMKWTAPDFTVVTQMTEEILSEQIWNVLRALFGMKSNLPAIIQPTKIRLPAMHCHPKKRVKVVLLVIIIVAILEKIFQAFYSVAKNSIRVIA